jgi:hypothetical protein
MIGFPYATPSNTFGPPIGSLYPVGLPEPHLTQTHRQPVGARSGCGWPVDITDQCFRLDFAPTELTPLVCAACYKDVAPTTEPFV